MAANPVFPLYYNDFDRSTRDWTDEEVGAYIRLLVHQWDMFGLPLGFDRLSRIATSVEKHWPLLSSKFKNIGGQLVNERLEEIRHERLSYSQRQAENGKKGGRPVKANQNPEETQDKANDKAKQKPSSSSSSSILNTNTDSLPLNTNIIGSNKNLTPPARRGREKKTKDGFVAPDYEQAQAYFLKKMSKPWGDARCKNEADQFVDNYKMNGWVQAKGKPIVDWEAAARKWIRNVLNGTFVQNSGTFVQKNGTAVIKKDVPARILEPLEVEINYLFATFWDGKLKPDAVTAQHYHFLKDRCGLTMTPAQMAEIHAQAGGYCAQNCITAEEANIRKWTKVFAVLEYFRHLSSIEGEKEVFKP